MAALFPGDVSLDTVACLPLEDSIDNVMGHRGAHPEVHDKLCNQLEEPKKASNITKVVKQGVDRSLVDLQVRVEGEHEQDENSATISDNR